MLCRLTAEIQSCCTGKDKEEDIVTRLGALDALDADWVVTLSTLADSLADSLADVAPPPADCVVLSKVGPSFP